MTAPQPPIYEIRVAGRLSSNWDAWFDGLSVTSDPDGTSVIRGSVVDQAALVEHCLEHMSKHKAPRYVWFMDEPLPRNASGKFLRRELKEHFGKLVEEA